MGQVSKVLAEVVLPERDSHNCRVFVDLAESVHIHYREHRLVFHIDEFIAVAKVFTEALPKLAQRVKEGYKEQNGYSTEIISGSQVEPIEADKPKESYFNNRMVVEKQAPTVMDKIHIHYRDYRLVMNNKETFLKFCSCVETAKKNLEW